MRTRVPYTYKTLRYKFFIYAIFLKVLTRTDSYKGSNLTFRVPRAIRQMYFDGTRVVFDIFLSESTKPSEEIDLNNISCLPLYPEGRGYLMCSRMPTPKPWRGRRKASNRPGTKCFLKCPHGYQLHGEYELTCRSDGTWDGPKHGECVSKWNHLIYGFDTPLLSQLMNFSRNNFLGVQTWHNFPCFKFDTLNKSKFTLPNIMISCSTFFYYPSISEMHI